MPARPLRGNERHVPDVVELSGFAIGVDRTRIALFTFTLPKFFERYAVTSTISGSDSSAPRSTIVSTIRRQPVSVYRDLVATSIW